ncbi:hypothetical protein [Solemya velum gill symbiont]|uniref:hypothetical protein n=1 Tax=Solemya velum gill symbiont TaxID=2340 RepID=UPI0018A88276|nr:hypothetical protein [Solemya velum gill symbiont]
MGASSVAIADWDMPFFDDDDDYYSDNNWYNDGYGRGYGRVVVDVDAVVAASA